MNLTTGSISTAVKKLFFVMCASLLVMSCQQSSDGPSGPAEKWHVFTQSNSPLTNNRINGLALSSGGAVWMATQDGASKFTRGNWGTFKDSLTYTSGETSARIVTSIFEGKDRSIWFGLRGGGVMRYNQSSDVAVWRRYRDQIADISVTSLAADNSNQTIYGEMWLTTAFGISRFLTQSDALGGGSWLQPPYTRGNTSELPSNQILSATTKLDDYSIWFGTQTGGPVSVVDGATGLQWQNYPLPSGHDSRINSIGWDLHNTVWLGMNNGVATYNLHGANWNFYTSATTNGKLPQTPVNAVVTNLLNTRWFGTDSGLVRLVDTTWTHFTRSNSPLPSDTVTSLIIDTGQNIWIGTPSGAAVYNPNGISY